VPYYFRIDPATGKRYAYGPLRKGQWERPTAAYKPRLDAGTASAGPFLVNGRPYVW
jgi:hypothetical protein